MLGLCGCDQVEESQEELTSWGTGAAGRTIWNSNPKPTNDYEIESTITRGGIENFLNLKENKISYKSFNAKTHFLTIQGIVFDKKKKTEKQLFEYSHRKESSDSGTAYLYFALAPEGFEIDFFSSKHWKLYIESGSKFSGNQQSGTYEQRMLIPNLSEDSTGITFSASRGTDSEKMPYIRVLDTSNFEIRIYSDLVENQNRANQSQ